MEFGIFHTAKNVFPDVFEELLKSDYVNVFLSEGKPEDETSVDMLKGAKREGKKVYVAFFQWIFYHVTYQKMVDVGEEYSVKCELKEGWEKIIDEKLAFLRSLDCDEAIAGFYIDEPLLNGISLDDFERATGYLAKSWKGKRIFCCFSIAGVAPDIWTTGNIQPITPKAGQYLTDIAFDMYHKFDEKYAYIAEQMKERMGNRKDVRIWYVPCTMNYRGDKDEQHCLEHLHGCYELLKKEENPGGLMCFTYYTFPAEVEALGNIGLDHLQGKYAGDANWQKLFGEILSIGRECVGKK